MRHQSRNVFPGEYRLAPLPSRARPSSIAVAVFGRSDMCRKCPVYASEAGQTTGMRARRADATSLARLPPALVSSENFKRTNRRLFQGRYCSSQGHETALFLYPFHGPHSCALCTASPYELDEGLSDEEGCRGHGNRDLGSGGKAISPGRVDDVHGIATYSPGNTGRSAAALSPTLWSSAAAVDARSATRALCRGLRCEVLAGDQQVRQRSRRVLGLTSVSPRRPPRLYKEKSPAIARQISRRCTRVLEPPGTFRTTSLCGARQTFARPEPNLTQSHGQHFSQQSSSTSDPGGLLPR